MLRLAGTCPAIARDAQGQRSCSTSVFLESWFHGVSWFHDVPWFCLVLWNMFCHGCFRWQAPPGGCVFFHVRWAWHGAPWGAPILSGHNVLFSSVFSLSHIKHHQTIKLYETISNYIKIHWNNITGVYYGVASRLSNMPLGFCHAPSIRRVSTTYVQNFKQVPVKRPGECSKNTLNVFNS